MVRTIMLRDSIVYVEREDRLDAKINDFIRDSKAKIIDIKFAPTGADNRPTALVIYEVEENE